MAIIVGSVGVDVVPDASRFWKTFQAKTSAGARSAGEALGRQIAAPIASRVADAIQDGVRRGSQAKANIQVVADTTRAKAQIAALATGNKGVTIQVSADTARARGELAAVKSAADSVSRTRVNIDTDQATQSVNKLGRSFLTMRTAGPIAAGVGIAIVGSLVPSLLSVAAAAGSALVAVTALAAGLGAGLLGAVASVGLAFKGVGEGLAALTARQQQAGQGAKRSANQQANAAFAIANAQRGVQNAHRGVEDAHRGVANAVRGLADAQRNAKRAQEDLNRARQQAKRDLEDLTLAVEANRLSMRRANLDVERAKEDLDSLGPSQQEVAKATSALATAQERFDKVSGNTKSSDAQKLAAQVALDAAKQKLATMQASVNGTQLERKEAKLAYDEAVQRKKQASVDLKRSTSEKATADRVGIAGSEGVRAATERVADANRGVQDAHRGVAAAQRGVQDAQRGVADAQRQLAQAMKTSNGQAAQSVGRVADAFDRLPKAAQKFVKFLQANVLPELRKLQVIAGKNLFPGLTKGLKAMAPLWPVIARAVGQFSRALGGLAASAGKALGGKFWKDFVKLLGEIGSTAITEAGKSFGYLAKTFAILFTAFSPLIKQMLPGMTKLAKQFAEWAAGWVKSGGFKEFIEYIKKNGPKLGALIFEILKFALKLLIAFAPLAPIILPLLTMLFKALTKLMPVLRFIGDVFGTLPILLLAMIVNVIDFVANFKKRMKSMWEWVKKTWASGKKWVSKTWNSLWTSVKAFFVKVVGSIYRAFMRFRYALIMGFLRFKATVRKTWNDFWDGAEDKADSNSDKIKSAVANMLLGVRKAFKTNVANIGKIWGTLKDKLRTPIVAMIKVINTGIIDKYNKLATFFKLPESAKAPHISTKGFARGGILPGQSSFRNGDDQLVPMRRGEGVYVSEAMKDPYERARLHAVNNAAMKGQSLSGFREGGGFAKGGIVGRGYAKGGVIGEVLGNITNPFKWIQKGLTGALSGLGSGEFYEMLRAIPTMLLEQAKKFITSQLGFSGNAARIIKIAKEMDGAPYVWGGASKSGADCSGFMSILTRAGRGEKNPYMREYSTASFAGGRGVSGLKRNANSDFQVGVNPGSHMAGRVKGPGGKWVGVESGGSYGRVKYGSNRSIHGFQYQFGLTKWGNNDGLAKGGMVRKLDRKQYPFPLEGMPGMKMYDSGGYLPKGLSLVNNQTGSPEPVFNPSQFEAIKSGLAGGSGTTINAYLQSDSPRDQLDSLAFKIRHLQRGGVHV